MVGIYSLFRGLFLPIIPKNWAKLNVKFAMARRLFLYLQTVAAMQALQST